MNNSLGDKIRELRKRKHMTQEELADGICTSVSISRIENGIQMPSSAILDKILDRLGTSTYEICNIYYKNEQQKEFEDISKSIADLMSSGDISKAKREIKKLKAFPNRPISYTKPFSFKLQNATVSRPGIRSSLSVNTIHSFQIQMMNAINPTISTKERITRLFRFMVISPRS